MIGSSFSSFSIRREQRADGVTVVEPVGEVDILSAPQIKAELTQALQPGARVVVSLGEVRSLDSVGLSLLHGFHVRAQRDGVPILFADVAFPAAQVLALTGLDRRFRIYPSVETAILAA